MLKYIGKTLIQLVLMALVISFLIFAGLQQTNVDPIQYMLSPDSLSDLSTVEVLREKMGFNDPMIIRYFRWLSNIVQGDLGYSLSSGQPIGSLVASKLAATLELSGLALLLSTILGIGIGFLSAVKQNSLFDYIGRAFSVLGQSIPQYFFGIILLQIFSIQLGWTAISGRMSVGDVTFFDRFDHLILPLLAMTIALCSVLMRFTRNNMLDIVNKDYIKTARSKGIPEWKVYLKHVFRNSMRPVMIVLCFRLAILIGGSVAVESVFSWPGIGRLLTDSIVSGDYPVVMTITLLISVVVLLASFLVDIITALLDPRVRLGQ